MIKRTDALTSSWTPMLSPSCCETQLSWSFLIPAVDIIKSKDTDGVDTCNNTKEEDVIPGSSYPGKVKMKSKLGAEDELNTLQGKAM